MKTIYTLTELLKQSGCQYQVVDLGRRIQSINPESFAKIEQAQQAYPYPLRQTARLAIVYWNETKQPWIWFLQFQLDERGLLQPTDISEFIRFMLEAMGTRIHQNLTEEQQQKLANNPYTFTPPEEKMAVFHSQVRAMLKLPASQYYEHAQCYFQGKLGWNNWQTIGLQGITDICARLGQEQNAPSLLRALNHLPSEPCYALLGALEHTPLTEKIADKLQAMVDEEIQQSAPDLFFLSALLRALSGAPGQQLKQAVANLLAQPQLCHAEILIGIAGRSWSALTAPQPAELFLTRLAQTGQQTLFNQLFADLVMLPELRVILLPLLHTTVSEELANALATLQQQTRSR
ncbi:hypothetical protein VR7878_00313 [Vibrio ruber DSM 16370]|uniref:DUF3549 domain-containing protein n=1 Tax=Vibrio ruber (strain DSM 16370 / JCM 11486 / BCRC 17186 / CECT 7878 / LMG 23124 / VR1) TaxID=1123498 RepID=A0A1R4LAJ0_VIBR1|nr:DUF3549 family protein [Vibrio ruber]SJN53403.1 hypothetical protein VR7878_00313 [Vibrio ruber DSM 16370]